MPSFDLVVIGSGTAGGAVATRCARAGRSVAVVDREPYGGTCALRGCVRRLLRRSGSRASLIDARPVESLDTVVTDRPVQVFARAFNSSSVDFLVRWWTASTPLDEHRSRNEVVEAIREALDAAGIEIPFPYRTLTFKERLELALRGDDHRPDG